MVMIDSTQGARVALHELGGDGPLLLIAHATGFHARAYLPLAAELSDTYRVVGGDFRGHGDATSPTDGDFTWTGFGDDVMAFIDHLAPDRPIVAFGHSKGGAALVIAELARPGTFSDLYLYEPIIFPPFEGARPENPLAASARRRRETFDSFDAAITNFASKPPLSVFAPEALDAYVRFGFEPLDDNGVRIKCRGEDEASTYDMSTTSGAFERLGELALRVTIAASGDGGGPATFAPTIADRIDGATLVRLDDLDHFGPFADPARIAAAVRVAFRG
ncbi:MAG TPA: alpha/beta fold hydrolase [Acidimicrobiales bacterium]|nr:alpha/beta fold hydrolase [Acidimicrobiales bacterium]